MSGQLRRDVPSRSATEVGAGDFIKVGEQWLPIVSNSASGAERTPHNWEVRTERHGTFNMRSINRYAKAEDFD